MGNVNGFVKAMLPCIAAVIVAGIIMNWGDDQDIGILEYASGGFTNITG